MEHDDHGAGRSDRRHDPGFYFCLCTGALHYAHGPHRARGTLLPTISPPFAIAIAVILLFGRNGLITRQFLGIRPGPGVNDIYGLDGLIFVQVITFFPVAYLIIRAMFERIDASMEEAALSLGASKFHIFRTVTLPLLTPGLAASFLLLFVESLADLGNPLLLGGNVTCFRPKSIWPWPASSTNRRRRRSRWCC